MPAMLESAVWTMASENTRPTFASSRDLTVSRHVAVASSWVSASGRSVRATTLEISSKWSGP